MSVNSKIKLGHCEIQIGPLRVETGQYRAPRENIKRTFGQANWAAPFKTALRSFIDRSVRAVPEENRVSPAPQILGPIIEGIRYEPADTPVDEMFSRLLSCSMNTGQLKDAHPAFPQIIKQISADEAILLKGLADGAFSQIRPRRNRSSEKSI
jgi:hypothetical protein